jgi:hypothetical protein
VPIVPGLALRGIQQGGPEALQPGRGRRHQRPEVVRTGELLGIERLGREPPRRSRVHRRYFWGSAGRLAGRLRGLLGRTPRPDSACSWPVKPKRLEAADLDLLSRVLQDTGRQLAFWRGSLSAARQLKVLPIPPAGRPAIWSETHFCHIADGRLVGHWPLVHQLGLLQQPRRYARSACSG